MTKFESCIKDKYKFGANLIRLTFGIMFLFVAVKKFRMGYGGFAENLVTANDLVAKEIPHFLLYIYGYLLPAVEFLVGICLLLNKYTKQAYAVIGLIYLTFVFGQEYNGKTSKIGTEYMPAILMLIAGFFLQDKVEQGEA